MKLKHKLALTFGAATICFAAFGASQINRTAAANQPSAVYRQTKDAKLSAQELGGTYNFDPAHTNIGFRIRHMGLAEVVGNFTAYTGTIVYDANDATKSSVTFTAKVTSVNTGVEARDNHLRTADFFEVEKYPEMTFNSTKIEKKGENQFVATGDFTLKGVTKQISLPFTVNGFLKDQRGGIKMGASALTTINRQDYGITWGKVLDNGALALSNEVQINLQVEAAKQQPKTAAATK